MNSSLSTPGHLEVPWKNVEERKWACSKQLWLVRAMHRRVMMVVDDAGTAQAQAQGRGWVWCTWAKYGVVDAIGGQAMIASM